MIKSGELAKRLNVHPNTIRNWADEYSEFMSDKALGKAPGSRRRFTEDDGLVLATIADMRESGIQREQIITALRSGKLADILPALPTPEEEEARQQTALIPVAERDRVLDELRREKTDTERLTVERDRAIEQWQSDVSTLQERIRELSQELGRARGMLISGVALVIVLAVVAVALAAVLLTRG